MIPIIKKIEPPLFSSETMRRRIENFNKETENLRHWRQKSVRFRLPENELIFLKHELLSESHQKCVYCEQYLFGPGFMEIDHFRPISGAVGDQGERSDLHYYWLAYDWFNLLASCPECNRAKGPKFPVVSERVALRIMSSDLDGYESPMIVNPTRCLPEEHLLFSADGRLNELSLKGAYTISILKLNREHLVNRRLKHLEEFRRAMENGNANSFLNDDAEFSGMCRQLFIDLSGNTYAADSVKIPLDNTEITELSPEDSRKKEQSKYYATFPLITEIEIRGVLGLDSIKLKIPLRDEGSPGWLAILGENGVGKSSILRALALVLYEGNAVQELALNLADVLNDGCEEGLVAVRFDSGQYRRLIINKNGAELEGKVSDVTLLLLGYGATRLSATKSHPYRAESDMSRIANLFDSYVPLIDPSKWLSSLEEKKFDYAAAAIKNLLSLPEECYLSKSPTESDAISLNWFGTPKKLRWLSQGYQNILSLACDIMAMVFRKWSSTEAAQFIVLLDELENHLHPTWKMRLVSSMRNAFPRMQFIFTTHDPLCLRGLLADEVVLLKRSTIAPYKTEVIENLPSVADMRVDQILTSAYFGLRTTVDPKVEELFDEYYSLLDRESDLPLEDAARLGKLKVAVSEYDVPTLLDRDRLLYLAIDSYLARRKTPLPQNSVDYDADLFEEIDKLANTLASEGPTPHD